MILPLATNINADHYEKTKMKKDLKNAILMNAALLCAIVSITNDKYVC